MVSKNTICLWFDGTAEEAARFYAETFPDSSFTRSLILSGLPSSACGDCGAGS